MNLESSGADYLRRLKQDEECARPSASELAPATPAPPTSDTSTERRQSPRYKCAGSAQFRVGGTDVRTWGTFTDLSLNGCYVEMTATFPVGAMVDLVLELSGLRAEVKGEVRVSYPFLGIGIAFRDISEENRARLREMVRTLLPSARLGISPAAKPATSPASLLATANPAAVMQSVVSFFEERTLLSKEEFLNLIRQSQ